MEELLSSYKIMYSALEVLSHYFKENYPDITFIYECTFINRFLFSYQHKNGNLNRSKYIIIRDNTNGYTDYLDKKIYFYLHNIKKSESLSNQLQLLGLEFKVSI